MENKKGERAAQIARMVKTMPVSKVAKELGVSKSLVRYHMNGGKNGKYRKKTKAERMREQEDIFPDDFKARRLSLKECCAFMDISEAYNAISSTVTSSKGYKQVGNSIVKNCLVAVIGQMFEGHEEDYRSVKPPLFK